MAETYLTETALGALPLKLLRFLKERFARHDECEDCWYSCPKHQDYCGEADRAVCTCGYDEAQQLLAEWEQWALTLRASRS